MSSSGPQTESFASSNGWVPSSGTPRYTNVVLPASPRRYETQSAVERGLLFSISPSSFLSGAACRYAAICS